MHLLRRPTRRAGRIPRRTASPAKTGIGLASEYARGTLAHMLVGSHFPLPIIELLLGRLDLPSLFLDSVKHRAPPGEEPRDAVGVEVSAGRHRQSVTVNAHKALPLQGLELDGKVLHRIRSEDTP